MFFPPKRAGGETQEFDTTDRNTALDRREPAESARLIHFEDRLEVFEVRVLGKKLTGEKKKKVHCEEVHNMYSSIMVTVMKSWGIQWAGFVDSMRETHTRFL